ILSRRLSRFCIGMGGISKDMSESGMEKAQAAVRLRKPERRQVAMVVQCPDDLVSAVHPVRLVLAVVEKLDLSRFQEPIQAREGQAGPDRTPSPPFVGVVLFPAARCLSSGS